MCVPVQLDVSTDFSNFLGKIDKFYGEGKGPILMDNVECLGVESNVMECEYDRHTADCTHSKDAGVVCHSCE